MLETNIEPRERETFFYVAPPVHSAVPKMKTLSTTCHQQMHPGVYKVALACWVGLLGVFFVTFFSSANALFIVVIDAVYAVMFFGVPWALHRTTPRDGKRQLPLTTFLAGRFDTIYGPIRASEALLQVILVPLALGIGGIAIGFIIHAARAAY